MPTPKNIIKIATLFAGILIGIIVAFSPPALAVTDAVYNTLYANARRLHALLIDQGILNAAGTAATIPQSPAGTWTFTRAAAGTVTVTAADDNAVAAMTILPGGAAAMTLGGASTTSLTVTTDSTGTAEVVLPNGAIGSLEIDDDAVDGADLADTIDLDADLAFTLGAGEQTTFNKTATAATADNGVVINYTASDATSSTTAQNALYINNVASTEGADCLVCLDNSDSDDNVVNAIQIDNPTRFTSHFSTGNAAITLGVATTDLFTLTTDGTGTAEVALPAGAIDGTEILDGTVEAVDEAYAGRGQIVICGDATTVNNNTVYYGPITTVTATDIGGMDCDVTAAGNATEATADAPAFTAKAFHVRGMICRSVDHNAAAGISYTLRTAEGATTPSVTCSIADGVLDCVADVQTTTIIASGATVAVAVASSNDVGAAAFVCVIDIAY